MKQHFIYVIGREEGPVKVGITSSPSARLSTIQTGCHFKIGLLYCRDCRDREGAQRHEKWFHDVYRDKRLAGEWFDMEGIPAMQAIDTAIDHEIWFEYEAQRELDEAELNIWPWAGEDFNDGAHPNH